MGEGKFSLTEALDKGAGLCSRCRWGTEARATPFGRIFLYEPVVVSVKLGARLTPPA